LNFKFPQVVRQHALGVVGYITWVLCTIYSSFYSERILEPVKFWQIYRHQLVVHFFWDTV